MNIEIEIPEYSRSSGLVHCWDNGFRISLTIQNGDIVLRANSAGIRSLARQLLTLAQDSVPAGVHFHLDGASSLEVGSISLICERVNNWKHEPGKCVSDLPA